MKCSLERLDKCFKILLLNVFLIHSAFYVASVSSGKSRKGSYILSNFDYLVSQLYLQHCTFVEIGEGICSMFVELTLNKDDKPFRKQMFFGNCLCSEFRKWHLCSHTLTDLRPEDCEFHEGTSCPSSSARVHRRLCDVTGMSQWNPQCNCLIPLAGLPQEALCGFKTCFANPLRKTICGPRTVCGTAYCNVGEHGALFSVRCDRKCRNHRPFCEDPCPSTSVKRTVSSQWAEWKSVSSGEGECNMQQFETECLDEKKEPAYDCLGPGLLCCGKDETDCICEVKTQDGKLKAFRYMIKFGDDSSRCETNSRERTVRSAELKGDAKIWDRLIDVASKENDKSDSVSMFGKPVGFETYLKRKNKPDNDNAVYNDIVDDPVRVSLHNRAEVRNGILQKLVRLVSNRSQIVEKPIESTNVSVNDIVQYNRIKGESGNDTIKLQQTTVNKTIDVVKSNSAGGKQVSTNLLQQQTTSKTAESSLKTSPKIGNNNTQQTNKPSDGRSMLNVTKVTTLPTQPKNTTNKTVTVDPNKVGGKVTPGGVKSISHDVNEKPSGNIKNLVEQSDIFKMLTNTSNINKEYRNGSGEELGQNNQEKESYRTMINENTETSKNSGGTNVDTSKSVGSDSQNPLFQNIKNTSSLNGHLKNNLQSLIEYLEATNYHNKMNTSAPQTKETDKNNEKVEITNSEENDQNLSKGQEDINIFNLFKFSDRTLEETVDTNSQQSGETATVADDLKNKSDGESEENDASSKKTDANSKTNEEKRPGTKSKLAVQNSKEKDFKGESKMNTDKSKENDSTAKIINFISKTNEENSSGVTTEGSVQHNREKTAKDKNKINSDKNKINSDKTNNDDSSAKKTDFNRIINMEKITDAKSKAVVPNRQEEDDKHESKISTEKNKANNSSAGITDLNRIIGDEKSLDANSRAVTINSQEDLKHKSKVNTDKNEANDSSETLTDHNVQENNPKDESKSGKNRDKQDFFFGGILESENKEKDQESSLVEEEDKPQLQENKFQQEVVPQQGEIKHEQRENEMEKFVTSKPINQEFTAIHDPSIKQSSVSKTYPERANISLVTEKWLDRSPTKGSSVTVPHVPIVLLSEIKQTDTDNLSHSVKLTTAALQSNKDNQNNSVSTEKKITEGNYQNSMLNWTAKSINISQKTKSPSIISSLKKEQFIQNPVSDRKLKFGDIANLFPTYSLNGITALAMSPRHRLKPRLLQEVGGNEIKPDVQTEYTSDLLGAEDKNLLNSNYEIPDSLKCPNEPFQISTESNPSTSSREERPLHDYDDPEPVLKDLNVDKENIDEKITEALSKLADLNKLPGKVKWMEKPTNCESDSCKDKLEDEKNTSPSDNRPTLCVRNVRKRHKIKRN